MISIPIDVLVLAVVWILAIVGCVVDERRTRGSWFSGPVFGCFGLLAALLISASYLVGVWVGGR